MSERGTPEQSRAEGLPRLPPGRHGLDREFVVRNQRDRLTAGIIAAVAERGYHDATVSQICAAAGVSRRTFYTYFSAKEECFAEAFERIVEYLGEAMGAAGEKGMLWPELVRARLAELLGVFAPTRTWRGSHWLPHPGPERESPPASVSPLTGSWKS